MMKRFTCTLIALITLFLPAIGRSSPEVVTIQPSDGSISVPVSSSISVGVNEDMDPDTLTTGSFTLSRLPGFKAIAAGGTHTVALRNDDAVVAWGENTQGQTKVPPNLTGVTALAAGGLHTLALKDDGTVVAWGRNEEGQTTVPTGLANVKAIAGGYCHSVALKTNGTVVAWGRKSEGQITVPLNLTGVTAIAAGSLHTLALKDDGTVIAWGFYTDGQTTVPAGLTGVIAIATKGNHCLALKDDGTVVAWGYNGSGQATVPAGLIGVIAIAAGGDQSLALKADGTVVAWGSQMAIPPAGLSGVIAITAGSAHSVALKSDGTIVSWGWWNIYGQGEIPAGLSGVATVAAGNHFALALQNDGTVVAWGMNNQGQTNVPAGLTGVTAVAAGFDHAVALRDNGTVVAWRGNDGYGLTTVAAGLSGVTAIAAGDRFAVALKDDGTVVAWGDSNRGKIMVPTGLSGVTAIAGGYQHTLALKDDGTVVAWGYNDYGQTTVPADLTGAIAIAAGFTHSVALKVDGTVVAWGNNDYGQCSMPTGLSGVLAIAAGAHHSIALKSDGTVVVWGSNFYGESNVPAGLSDVIAISGCYCTMAVKRDGTVVAWGLYPAFFSPLDPEETAVAGAVTYDAGTRRATFTPAAPLDPGTTYHATVNTGVRSLAGEPLAADSRWSFTTEVLDVDGDGYDRAVDCDDSNPAVYPGAAESCDGLDNNCNGQTDEALNIDADHDGYTGCGGDCDDSNPAAHPGAREICDGIDNNCDGQADEGFLPLFAVTPASLRFQGIVGAANPLAQTLNIAITSCIPLSWTTSASEPWLSLSSTSGSDSGTLTVTVNSAGLAAGTYPTTIEFTAPKASPVRIAVTFILENPTIFVDAANTSGVEDGSATHPFNTIQEGLAAAQPVNNVSVAPGIYTGPIELKQDVHLVGTKGPENTFIDGLGRDYAVLTPYANSPRGFIEGFTVRHATTLFQHTNRYSVYQSSFLTINNCILRDAQTAVNAGIYANSDISGTLIVNATVGVTANWGTANLNNVTIDGVAQPLVVNHGTWCNLNNTTLTNASSGIHLNATSYGAPGLGGSNNNIWNCPITMIPYQSQVAEIRLNGTLAVDPLFVDPMTGNYRLQGSSPLIDAGTNIGFSYFGVAPDIGAYESSPDQDGAGCTIFVDGANASGVEDGSVAHPFNTIQEGLLAAQPLNTVSVAPGIYYGPMTLKQNVHLFGAQGPQKTIIDGMGGPQLAFTPFANLPHGFIEGFTVQNASILFQHTNRWSYYQSSFLTIKNCILRDAQTAVFGNTYASSDISQTLIIRVSVGVTANWGSANLNNVTIDGVAQPLVVNHGTWCTLNNTTMTNASSGILLTATSYGAPGIGGSNNNIWNCPINVVPYDIWNPENRLSSTLAVDPLFVDPLTDNYRLQGGSPLIDAGVDVGLPYGGSAPDIGAYELDLDHDGDGYSRPLDCNDSDAAIHPGVVEVCTDGVDNNCNGLADAADPACQTTAKHTYYFPSIKDDDSLGWENYLSVQAKEAVAMDVALNVYDLAGNLKGTYIYSNTIPGANSGTLAPNARVALRPSGIAGGAVEGSVVVETSVPAIASTNCIANYYKGFSIYEAAKPRLAHNFPKAYDGPAAPFFQVYMLAQNIYDQDLAVTVRLFGKTPADPGHGASKTYTVPAHGTLKVRPSEVAPLDAVTGKAIDFSGSVVITTDLAIPAMCRFEAGGEAIAIYESTVEQPALYFPVIKDGKFGGALDYQNFVSVVNPSATASATITLVLYNKAGTEEARLANTVILPGGKKTWRPSWLKGSLTLPKDFEGSIVVTTDIPVVGQTNTIYPGTNPYGADGFDLLEASLPAPTLFFPKVYDNLLGSGTGATHLTDNFVYVQNPDGMARNVVIDLYNSNGSLNRTTTVAIVPYATHVFRPKDLVTDASGVFRGSVRVTEASGLSLAGGIKYEVHRGTAATSVIEAMTIYRSMGQ